MLSTTFMLLVSGAFLMLRLGETAGSFPRPLPAREERRYVEAWLAGDVQARNILIEHNLRLVVHIVKKYYAASADAEDLISIGTVGLIKGVSSYRPEKGVRPRPIGGYTDWNTVPDWAYSATTWAVSMGILYGTSSTELSPNTGANRAQLALFMMRTCRLQGELDS